MVELALKNFPPDSTRQAHELSIKTTRAKILSSDWFVDGKHLWSDWSWWEKWWEQFAAATSKFISNFVGRQNVDQVFFVLFCFVFFQ